ncbi:MAG: DUF3823 domain-containing protein [Dysgonamonadaceae bacterium]|jgi:hypothetical protein|nr:DUF3823 domain-containing protein [Dysgonamonadaceae bacterium]
MLKNIPLFLSTLLIFSGLTSCEIDNYDTPDGGIFGQILDAETNAPVPQPVPSDFGLRLRFYESGRENSLEQHFYAQTDGSFRNSHIFNGPIRLVAEQRNFLPINALNIRIEGQTECNIPVVPYARIHIDNVSINEPLVTIHFSVSRSELISSGHFKIVQCNLLWHASPYIDNQTVNYAACQSLPTPNIPDEELLSAPYSRNWDLSTAANQTQLKRLAHLIQGNGGRIYMRISIVTEDTSDGGRYVNYSEIVPVQINIQSLLISIQ